MSARFPEAHPLARKYPRTSGLILLSFGFAIFYFYIIEPIWHANVGATIKLSNKYGVAGGFLMVAGFVLMILGSKAHSTSPKLVFILGLIVGGVCLAAMEFTKSYLRSKGYVL